MYLRPTKKYLPLGSRVLDGGCGNAQSVYGLSKAGYDAYGIDYAPETVSTINRLTPELKVQLGDVRNLPFQDGFFDGTWSPGVIEHFWEGFDAIAFEVARVTKSNGYAFVTAPSMSPLRRFKAVLGLYPAIDGRPEDFYQFALPKEAVIAVFEKAGFSLVEIVARGGFKGFKDEIRLPLLQKFYDSKATPLRAIRAGLDKLLAPLMHHTKLYIFRKT
jgi:SAM-dependent methyltransferase